MTFAYYLPFDVADVTDDFGTVTLEFPGKPDVVIYIASMLSAAADGGVDSSKYFHGHDADSIDGYDFASTSRQCGSMSASSFGGQFQSEIQTEAGVQGWAGTSGLTCSYSSTTMRYTIAYATGSFGLFFSDAITARLFGYALTAYDLLAASYAGTLTPYYVISPSYLDVSLNTPDYESEGIASQAISDNADVYGLARTIAPLYRDWIQQYETKEKTFRRHAVTAHLTTYQRIFEACRTALPFIVRDGFGGSGIAEAFMLRADGAQWKPDPASKGNDAQFHIPFRTVVLGEAT